MECQNMGTEEIFVSFVVPVYMVERYLRKCIDSLCSQTFKNMEIILVDDGSVDSCPKICDEYAYKDARIKVIHKKNGGQVSARMAGFKAATGKYISCVDGDDWIDVDTLQRLINLKTDAEMICFSVYEEFGNGCCEIKKNTVPEGFYQSQNDLNELYSLMLMNGNFFEMGILPYQCGKLIKKELLLHCQEKVPDNISYAEDAACIYPCLLLAKSVYVTNMPLYHYRIHQNSMVKKEVEPDKLNILFKTLKKAFHNHALSAILNTQLKYYMWHSLLLKGYSRIEAPMPLFPFEKVKSGMRIAVYGAGLFGTVIESYCNDSTDLSTAGWFDQRYDVYRKQGIAVQPSAEILNTDFDIMVIAILNVSLSKRIKAEYVSRGIEENKIDLINTDLLDQSVLPDFLFV